MEKAFYQAFFKAKDNEIIFLNSIKSLLRYKLKEDDKFFIWGKRIDYNALKTTLIKKAQDENLLHFTPKISLVEDGFIRSISLGSDLTRPFSLIVDSKGLYVDPTHPSDLEELLQNHEFDDNLRQRAKKLITTVTQNKFFKIQRIKA